jgi:hypothetical protein
LQHNSRKNNCTVFVNDDLQPYNDQWTYLAGICRLLKKDLISILDRVSESKEQLELAESEESDIKNEETDIYPFANFTIKFLDNAFV